MAKSLEAPPMAKNSHFSGFKEDRRAPRATSRPLPRPWIHLMISWGSLSKVIGIAQHEEGWPWVDSMPRSKVCRRVRLFSISFFTNFNVTTQIARCAACSRVNEKKTVLSIFAIAVVRDYFQPNVLLNTSLETKLCNIAFH